MLAQGKVPFPESEGDLVRLLSEPPSTKADPGGQWTFQAQPSGTYTVFFLRKNPRTMLDHAREELTLPGKGEVSRELRLDWTPASPKLLAGESP